MDERTFTVCFHEHAYTGELIKIEDNERCDCYPVGKDVTGLEWNGMKPTLVQIPATLQERCETGDLKDWYDNIVRPVVGPNGVIEFI